MVSQLDGPMHQITGVPLHCSDLFAVPFQMLFDAGRRNGLQAAAPMEVPLWSGLRLQALASLQGRQTTAFAARTTRTSQDSVPLRDVETALIRKAVADARGNVMQAARALGGVGSTRV